jgi:hypothetical protein
MRPCRKSWGMTHEMSFSIEESTELVLSDLRNEGKPGVVTTTLPDMVGIVGVS